MKYISGIHALNLPCSLDTCGDWHRSAIQWKKPCIRDTEKSIFGSYGIEKDVTISFLDPLKKYNVANYIRALLDLLTENNFPTAQGMRDDFICNDQYTEEIFDKVWMLRSLENWPQIDKFMSSEYKLQWLKYKKNI